MNSYLEFPKDILINKKTLDNTLKIKDLISIHLKARAHMALLLIDKSQQKHSGAPAHFLVFGYPRKNSFSCLTDHLYIDV